MIKGIVISAKPDVTKQGNSYLVLTVADLENKYQISVWSAKPSDIKVGQGVQIKEKDSDGFLSCTIADVKKYEPSVELQALIPKSCSQKEWSDIVDKCVSFYSAECVKEKEFTLKLADMCYTKYKTQTAARSHHHAFLGGLLQHTYELLKIFTGLYEVLPYKVNPFIVTVASIMHDYGKMVEYTQDFEYQPSFFMQGHPYLGAEAAGILLRKEGFDYRTIQFIQHCILSHHGNLEYGSPVVPCNPEAYLVSMLDALSGVGVQYDQPTGTKVAGTQLQRF